jgi:hypothetical protein
LVGSWTKQGREHAEREAMERGFAARKKIAGAGDALQDTGILAGELGYAQPTC